MTLTKVAVTIIADNGAATKENADRCSKLGFGRITRIELNASDDKRIMNDLDDFELIEGEGVMCYTHTFENSRRTTYLFCSPDLLLRSVKSFTFAVRRGAALYKDMKRNGIEDRHRQEDSPSECGIRHSPQQSPVAVLLTADPYPRKGEERHQRRIFQTRERRRNDTSGGHQGHHHRAIVEADHILLEASDRHQTVACLVGEVHLGVHGPGCSRGSGIVYGPLLPREEIPPRGYEIGQKDGNAHPVHLHHNQGSGPFDT